MFQHFIADKNDIIADNSKFGYSEHIKLAKKIIGFGSIQNQLYVQNNAINSKTVLPSILTIYHKDDIMLKTKNHRRKRSNESDYSLNNNITADNSNLEIRSSSNSSDRNSYLDNQDKERKELFLENYLNIINENNINNTNDNNNIFKSNSKSRFEFVNINNNILYNNKNNDKVSSNLIQNTQYLINELCSRLSFFIQFNNNIPLSKIEYDFCRKLYTKSKNDEIKAIIDNIF